MDIRYNVKNAIKYLRGRGLVKGGQKKMTYGYEVGDSVRIGGTTVFIISQIASSVSILWADGTRTYDSDSFSVCNCKKISKQRCRRHYPGMQIRQCDGEFASIYGNSKSTKRACIYYHDKYFDNADVLPFLQGIYKLEDDHLVVGTIEEREETLKSMGITDKDLIEEEYEQFEAVYGTSVSQQKQIDVAREEFVSKLQSAGSEKEREALLSSYDKKSNLTEGVLNTAKEVTEQDKVESKPSEVSAEPIKAEEDKPKTQKCVTLSGLGDGLSLNMEKPKEEEKPVKKEESKAEFTSLPISIETAKIGMNFRNKLGVLFTVIEVGNDSIKLVAGNKAGKVVTVTSKNLASIESIGHVFGSRVGIKHAQVNGVVAEIVEDTENRLTVRYECGSYQTGISYEDFANGRLVCPIERENYLKRSYAQKNGAIATIVAYRSKDDVSILLNNGTFVEGVNLDTVSSGSFVLDAKKGDTRRNALGMLATVSQYKDRNNMSVTFEDGSIVNNVTLDMFLSGSVIPDYIYKVQDKYCIGMIHGITKTALSSGKYLYEGTCLACQKKVSGTREQLQSHVC